MTGKQLKVVRNSMNLTQAELAGVLRVARNSVVRMENGQMIVTPPMGLLIQYVAREAGVEVTGSSRGSRTTRVKERAHGAKARASRRGGRKTPALPPKRR
jgi:DNA-binding XRE family transcriptional regulator